MNPAMSAFQGALRVSLGAVVVMAVAYLLSRASKQKGSEDKLEGLEGIISALRDIQQTDVK